MEFNHFTAAINALANNIMPFRPNAHNAVEIRNIPHVITMRKVEAKTQEDGSTELHIHDAYVVYEYSIEIKLDDYEIKKMNKKSDKEKFFLDLMAKKLGIETPVAGAMDRISFFLIDMKEEDKRRIYRHIKTNVMEDRAFISIHCEISSPLVVADYNKKWEVEEYE